MPHCKKVNSSVRPDHQGNSLVHSAQKKKQFAHAKNGLHSKKTEAFSSQDLEDKKNDEGKKIIQEQIHSPSQETTFLRANRYHPYFSMGGVKFFNHPQKAATTYDLFIPLWQDSNWLSFTDLRIFNRTEKPFEGNIHLGYRYLFPETKQIAGIYGSFDRKRTVYGHYFNQALLGGEYWRHDWFFGGNFYIPVGVKKRITGESKPFHYEKRPVFRVSHQYYEETTRGLDGEIGYAFRKNLIGYLGGFYFKGENTKAIKGPRVRIDYLFYPQSGKKLLGIFDGAELRTGVKKDASRGTTCFIELKAKIGLSSHSHQNLSSFEYHMIDLLRRDPDIITSQYNVIQTTKNNENNTNSTLEKTPPSSTQQGALDVYRGDPLTDLKPPVDPPQPMNPSQQQKESALDVYRGSPLNTVLTSTVDPQQQKESALDVYRANPLTVLTSTVDPQQQKESALDVYRANPLTVLTSTVDPQQQKESALDVYRADPLTVLTSTVDPQQQEESALDIYRADPLTVLTSTVDPQQQEESALDIYRADPLTVLTSTVDPQQQQEESALDIYREDPLTVLTSPVDPQQQQESALDIYREDPLTVLTSPVDPQQQEESDKWWPAWLNVKNALIVSGTTAVVYFIYRYYRTGAPPPNGPLLLWRRANQAFGDTVGRSGMVKNIKQQLRGLPLMQYRPPA